MKLIELREIHKNDYNQFVANNPSGSFLQSWEWGNWQASLGRAVYRFKITDDSGEQIASVQFIKMPLPFGRYYLYAPYGPVFGSRKSEVGSRIIQELQKKFTNAVFIRMESKDSSLIPHPSSLIKTKNIQPGKTLLIDLTKSEEQLLLEMHHKTRYNIKIAQKHGVEIKDEFSVSVGHGLFFNEALKLIIQTSKRQKFTTFGVDYYKKMVDFFSFGNPGDVQLHIYKAIFQNQLLSAAIIMDFSARGGSTSGGGTRTFLFGGSSEFHKNVMAPYLLHWQAMRDAKLLGLNFYDFWGIETSSGDTPGFVRFKLGFGGQEIQYAGAYDSVINKFLYKLYSGLRLGNKIIKKIRSVK